MIALNSVTIDECVNCKTAVTILVTLAVDQIVSCISVNADYISILRNGPIHFSAVELNSPSNELTLFYAEHFASVYVVFTFSTY